MLYFLEETSRFYECSFLKTLERIRLFLTGKWTHKGDRLILNHYVVSIATFNMLKAFSICGEPLPPFYHPTHLTTQFHELEVNFYFLLSPVLNPYSF